MAKHRLLNCEFINASSFKVNVSNRAKLLYLMMFANGDDKGFVDTTNDLINALEKNDNELDKVERLELLENTYTSALNELKDKGYIYEFRDNHSNRVHLIRHWFYHNQLKKGLWTNYRNFLELVHLENNEYILNNKKPLKENKLNQDKLNQDKLNKDMNELEQEHAPTQVEDDLEDKLFKEMFGNRSYTELSTEEQDRYWKALEEKEKER